MPLPVKILILEDQLIIAEDTADMLRNEGYEIVGIATDYDEAIALLQEHKPDFAILDITIKGEKKGTEVGQFINQHSPIPFIYLTSHSDRDTLNDVKQTNPLAFLMKPFLRKNLLATIEIAIHNYAEQKQAQKSEDKPAEMENSAVINDHFLFKDGHKYVKLHFSDILYFKSDGNYAELKTPAKKYLLRTTMKKVQEQLPQQQFLRCHKQYIINVSKVLELNSSEALVANEYIPIGREYKDELMSNIGLR
jgi:two-component system, LytTR family, response regulator LytT